MERFIEKVWITDNVFIRESEWGGHFIKHLNNVNIGHINLRGKKYINTHDFPIAGSSLIHIEVLEERERG